MLSFTELNKPRIDIEIYGTETNISPENKVKIMDEDSFEQFITEWLYGCKKENYVSIKRIGGAGDKGRDVIGYYNDNSVDYYQCKHYHGSLTPSDFYVELAKLCYYTYKKEIPVPKHYYIVASNNVGPKLQGMIDKPTQLRQELIVHWDDCCRDKITQVFEIALDGEFFEYVNKFNFGIIKSYPISQVIDEHINTIYGILRFGGREFCLPQKLTPPEVVEKEEMPYILALLEAYSEELNIKIDTTDKLKIYEKYFNHLSRQRKDYYALESIRRFARDAFTNMDQFEVLEEEVYNGIIDTYEKDYENGFKRLVAVLEQVSIINTSKSMLDSKLHCIGNSERKGACHILVNEGKIKWVKNDEGI